MTATFATNRLIFYVAVFLLSGTVLGISSYFASIFLPSLHHDFTIFSIVISSLTILLFLISVQFGQPRTEAIIYFILGSCWLAMGAWSNDIIGTVQCDGLRGQRTATKNGDMSAQSYCYESKVIQAFSWMIFVLFALALIILVSLASQAQRLGRPHIWSEPIQELGWFGEWPGYYNNPGQLAQTPQMAPYPQYGAYPNMMPGTAGTPGQSIIIQPGMNGAAPTVHTVPHSQA